MLRIYFIQRWLQLYDPGAEELLYDPPVMSRFVGIDLGEEPDPDKAAICKFRHLMERHNLGGERFRLMNVYFQENGLTLSREAIVNATIIDTPKSAKNKDHERDPNMALPRKTINGILA